MRGRGVQVPPVVLGILTMVALRTGQSEHPLLENGIDAVPEGQPKTQVLLEVTNGRHAIFVPSVGARAGVVEREVVPCVAVSAVILAHRTPGPLGYVGPPLPPGGITAGEGRESLALGVLVHARDCTRFRGGGVSQTGVPARVRRL